MSNRSICKFFVDGACFKGDYCGFSHDWNDQPNNVCTFYHKGVCSYGSRCRYEHVKVSCDHLLPSTTTALAASNSSQVLSAARYPHCKECQTDADYIPGDGNSLSSRRTAQNQASLQPVHLPICSSAAAGTCPYGEECPQMHGDLCTTCGKQCLHPYRSSESEVHIKLCKRNNKRLETLKKSEEIECSVCLERVLSKPTTAERRFGLLPECDHSFCITCIRKWRSSSLTSAINIDSTVRACPICRMVSYYVIPSATWYSSKEEKQEIIDGYKAKLKSIDCKYFDFGKDTCPFGGRCFYKHACNDGRLEEVAAMALLHFHADDASRERARNVGFVSLLGPSVQFCNFYFSDRKSWLPSRLAYLLDRLHL